MIFIFEPAPQVCLCAIAVLVALFTLAAPRPDPFIALVACWALLGIFNELNDPENLMNPEKFNFIDWPTWTLEAVQRTALVLSLFSAGAGLVGVARGFWKERLKMQKSLTDAGSTEV